MATEFNKSGSGKFNSRNKFSGRAASGSSEGSSRFKGKPDKFNSGDKKVFNRSDRFDRGPYNGNRENRGNQEANGNRENTGGRENNRFGGFKSDSKFKKSRPFTGNPRFSKDTDGAPARSIRFDEDGDDKREGGERPRQPYNPNRNYNTENQFRKSPFGDVPKGKPGERNRSFKAEKEAYRQRLEQEGNSHGERFGKQSKPYNRAPEEGNRTPKSFNRADGERKPFNRDRPDTRKPYGRGEESGERKSFNRNRDEASGNRSSYNRGNEDANRERKPFSRDRELGNYNSTSFNRSREEGRPSRGEFVKKPFGDRDKKEGNRHERKPFNRTSEGQQSEAPDYDLRRYNNRERSRNEDNERTNEGIRLNRYIANAGVCSRREADNLIAAGEIKVNGEVVTEMGYVVKPEDTVQYGKKRLNREKMVYVLLNKPKDFITTTEDPEGRKTVMDLVATASKERIFPVGRLDRNTTGLLLFTNDGELAQKLTHPSHKNSKIYQVELDKPITKDDFEKIQAGLELEDGKAEVDDLALIGDTGKFLGIEIHIGKNRIVRRIFEHLGYEVVSLDRVQYAGLTKKDLPRGKWRFLNEKEVIRLKYFL